MRLWWLIAALLLCGALLALQWWALDEFLYWRYEWFDIPMHYLGGLSIGVLFVGFLKTHRPLAFVLALVGAFVAWELFEFFSGIPLEANYPADTALDLVMDGLGGVTAYALARATIWKKA